MNDSDLENQLRALRPSAPSPHLRARLAEEIAAAPQPLPLEATTPALVVEPLLGKILRPIFWTAAGAAAAVVVMNASFAARPPVPVSPVPVAAAAPVSPAPQPQSTCELLGTAQGEVRYEKDRGPVREVRARYLEHLAWTDQRTGGRVEISIPREDVYLQPIAMQ
jgi:hypothetical protein